MYAAAENGLAKPEQPESNIKLMNITERYINSTPFKNY